MSDYCPEGSGTCKDAEAGNCVIGAPCQFHPATGTHAPLEPGGRTGGRQDRAAQLTIHFNENRVHVSEPLRDWVAREVDLCAHGHHRPAWLVGGGVACGRCGVRL